MAEGLLMTPDELIARYEMVWPEVKRGLSHAQIDAVRLIASPITVTDIDRIHAKGQRGWLEHAAGITHMSTDQMLVEARAEVDDLLWYLSFRAATLGARL
jgi:hypothetical protein